MRVVHSQSPSFAGPASAPPMSGSPATKSRAAIAAEITQKILAELERGTPPWRKPWDPGRISAPALPMRVTGEPYRGANVVLLWMAAHSRGYAAPIWMTFQQALKLGAHVRKGERGEAVIFFGAAPARTAASSAEATSDGQEPDKPRAFLKRYVVFNVEQIERLPERYCYASASVAAAQALEGHEAWFARLNIDRVLTRDQAFYAPSRDVIGMPPVAAFDSPDHYAATLTHEAVHATMHASRLGRDYRARYPDHHYAVEELTAELGAAFLGVHLGLPPAHLHDHAAYIGSWIKALRDQPQAFLEAASKAQAAVDWLLAKSPVAELGGARA